MSMLFELLKLGVKHGLKAAIPLSGGFIVSVVCRPLLRRRV